MIDKIASIVEPVFDDKIFLADPRKFHDCLIRHMIHNISSCSKLDGLTQNIHDFMRVSIL